MTDIIVLVLAVLSGVASHYELSEFNKTASEGKIPPIAAGAAGFVLGLLIAFIAPALVVGALLGLVCWHEVKIFERQAKAPLLGMKDVVWAGVVGVIAFVGGSIAPLFPWFVLCVFAAGAGAFWLLFAEMQRLQEENRMWTSENQRLLLERGARSASAASSAPPAATPVAPAPPVAAAWAPASPASAPALRSGAVRKPPSWGAQQRPSTGGGYMPGPPPSGGDFLPRR